MSLQEDSILSNLIQQLQLLFLAFIYSVARERVHCQYRVDMAFVPYFERKIMLLTLCLLLDLLKKVFVWNKENLESQLPLQPGCQACLTLYIHGASDYLPLSQSGKDSIYI